jgi:hypothetical protein
LIIIIIIHTHHVYVVSEYVNRVILYKQQIWTCAYTSKENLTYEEALRCERKHLYRLIHAKYPRHVVRPICDYIHHSKANNAKTLADDIMNAFATQFLTGEEVMCRFEGRLD